MLEHANSVQIRAFIKFLAVLKRRALVTRFNSEQPIFAAVGMCLYFILFFVCCTHSNIQYTDGRINHHPNLYLNDLFGNILGDSLFGEFKSKDYGVIFCGFYYVWFLDVIYWEIMILCYFYFENMDQTLNFE